MYQLNFGHIDENKNIVFVQLLDSATSKMLMQKSNKMREAAVRNTYYVIKFIYPFRILN